MKIEYRVELEDLRAFLHYAMRTNPVIRRQRRWIGVWLALLLCVPATLLAHRHHSLLPFLTFGIAGAIYLVYFFKRTPSVSKRQVAWLYPEGENKGLLCEHTLVLTDSALVETTPTGEQKTVLGGILKVVDIEDHVFIFISTQMAHVIPKSKILSGDLNAFVSRLMRDVGPPPRGETSDGPG